MDMEHADAQAQAHYFAYSARHFVEFALRHTWPDRAMARTPHETHSILRHHPFVKLAGINLAEDPPPRTAPRPPGDREALIAEAMGLAESMVTRAKIRRQNDERKSVREGRPDRLAAQLEEASALLLEMVRHLALAAPVELVAKFVEDGANGAASRDTRYEIAAEIRARFYGP